MPDDAVKKVPRDPARVDIHDYAEVEYWCRRIRCTRAQLVVAVHTVGPSVDGVITFLRAVAPRPHLAAIPVKNFAADSAPKIPHGSEPVREV